MEMKNRGIIQPFSEGETLFTMSSHAVVFLRNLGSGFCEVYLKTSKEKLTMVLDDLSREPPKEETASS